MFSNVFLNQIDTTISYNAFQNWHCLLSMKYRGQQRLMLLYKDSDESDSEELEGSIWDD